MSDELPEYSPEDDVIPNFESDQLREQHFELISRKLARICLISSFESFRVKATLQILCICFIKNPSNFRVIARKR